MKIAIIVWGSLHWRPEQLKFTGEWFFDGPMLPIEFARISSGNRISLVIKPNFNSVLTLYCISTYSTLEEARENLRIREGTDAISNIGYLDFIEDAFHARDNNRFILDILREWNATKNFDAILWSDFAPNFVSRLAQPFNLNNVISFLSSLPPDDKNSALEYIRNAPKQIQTRFRESIEIAFPT
jgi:hypothetical protein